MTEIAQLVGVPEKGILSGERWLVALLVAAVVLIAVDVRYAAEKARDQGAFAPLSALAVPEQEATTRVAIVRSDDAALPESVPLSHPLSYEQIEAMTRRAVDLAGGFDQLIRAGDRVLIKPCIVSPQVHRNTDVRVVKAVVRLVHQAAGGDVEVIVGEGSAEPTLSEIDYAPGFSTPSWEQLWNAGGYETLLADPDLASVNLRLSNLNGPWEDLVQVEIPGGGFVGYRAGKIWVHKDVLEADVHITVPALKLHPFTGITVGFKNNIGLYPGTRYGFSKRKGVPQDGFSTRLVHQDDLPQDWVDEEIVDMALVAGIDFAVVDAINCEHRRYRRNAILAGSDLVAVDHVASRLMGLNPDDIGHLTLASLAGMGTNDPARIETVGTPIDALWVPFPKWDAFSHDFGQSNRIWLLRGPFELDGIDDPMARAFVSDEANMRPHPGEEGWSEPIYFFDDRIDLGSYYDVEVGQEVAAYAFTYFDAPESQRAELWLGSDEDMRIYLNGQPVYEYSGYRTYGEQALVLAKVPVELREGENTLVVKALQRHWRFDFALNICEPETNPELDGNRVLGLQFRTEPAGITAVPEEGGHALPQEFVLGHNYPNPFNANTVIPYRVPTAGGSMPTKLAVYNVRGQLLRTLVDRPMAPGAHLRLWDGRAENGSAVASGVYWCRLQVGAQVGTQKLLLLR